MVISCHLECPSNATHVNAKNEYRHSFVRLRLLCCHLSQSTSSLLIIGLKMSCHDSTMVLVLLGV